MLKYKLFKISCLLLIWTKIEASEVPEDRKEVLSDSTDNDIDATVWNFFPIKGKQKWMRREFPPVTEMLFFNMSTIGDNEEVTLAQLHLHRRRLTKTNTPYHKKFLPAPYRVVLYQIQPDYKRKHHEDARTTKLASLPVSHLSKGGWHVLDVTAIVRELLINAQGPVELLLGVHFEAPKRLDKPYTPLVPLKHFLKYPWLRTPEHKAASYLVVFSKKDPYFEDFDENDATTTTTTTTTTTLEKLSFKERHLKHKISKNNQETNNPPKKSNGWKHKMAENEVLKKDVIRHKGKHRGGEVKRSKADELALKERTKLKSLPFLHANEVEEIRQTSRRLTRSSGPSGPFRGPETPGRAKRLINSPKVKRTHKEP